MYKEKERSLKWQWEATNPCYPEVRSLEEKVVLHLSGTDGPPGCSYLKMEPLQLEIQIHPLQKQQFFRWIKIKGKQNEDVQGKGGAFSDSQR